EIRLLYLYIEKLLCICTGAFFYCLSIAAIYYLAVKSPSEMFFTGAF
ncbi:MAG: hypothetical protein ACI8ZO_001373, partial [Flavobacteriales bacterium]